MHLILETWRYIYGSWDFVTQQFACIVSGKSPQLYRHDLLALHNKHTHRFSLPMNKIPEKLVPRKFVMTTKVPDTKGCLKCAVGRNPYNGYKYLCGATATGVFLMQWYEPLNKFMLLKVSLKFPGHQTSNSNCWYLQRSLTQMML